MGIKSNTKIFLELKFTERFGEVKNQF